MELFKKKTIKSKLIQSNFCIICIITILASTCSYVTANKKTVQLAKNSLKYDMENITYSYQLAYEEMLNIMINCTERKTFNLKDLDQYLTIESRSRAMQYVNLINDFCAITGYGSYITKLSVFNDKGALIQGGSSLGSSDDYERILSTDWFKSELNKTLGCYQLDLVDSPFYSDNRKILPIARRLSENEGLVLICLSTKLFEDVLNEKLDKQEAVVVTSSGKRITSINELLENQAENDEIIQTLLYKKENKGLLEMKVHGKQSLVVYEKDNRSGILIYETLPLESIKNDKLLLIQTIVIMFSACLIIGLILSIIFTNQVKKPIDNLVRHIEIISHGNFVKNKSLESEDEIGIIGKVVNNMSEQIKNLMEQCMDDEKEKSSLELKMLQAQINPHFLYNTLDSIKWIAIIQKNSGIVKVVTALSGLLKNMAKGFNEKITLQNELEFLNDYVTIEKIKYVELFDLVVNVENELLYEAKVIKLTLQPLVENAIFNGIEPSGKNGTININVFTKNNELYITVRDNGIGISKNKLEHILSDNEKSKNDHMSGIGLSNVHQRLKLTYGDKYGLKVESIYGEYTQITIKMPLEY